MKENTILIGVTILTVIIIVNNIAKYQHKVQNARGPFGFFYAPSALLAGLMVGFWGEIFFKSFWPTAYLAHALILFCYELIGRHQKLLRFFYFILRNVYFFICFFIIYLIFYYFIKNEIISLIITIISYWYIDKKSFPLWNRIFPYITIEDQIFYWAYQLRISNNNKEQNRYQFIQSQYQMKQLWQEKFHIELQKAQNEIVALRWQKANNRYEKIIKKLNSLQKVAGKFELIEAIAWAGRGNAELLQNNVVAAEKLYKKAIDIVPGKLNDNVAEIKNAINFLALKNAKGRANSPGALDLYLRYISINQSKNNKDYQVICSSLEEIAAIDEYKQNKADFNKIQQLNLKILKINSKIDWVHCNLGMSYFYSKQYDKSLRHFEEATSLNPKLFKAYYYMGLIVLAQQQIDQAEIFFRKSIEINSEIPETHFELGRILISKAESLMTITNP